MQASEAGSQGDVEKKRKYDKISVGLTVTGIICEVVGPIVIIIVGAVAGTLATGAAIAGTAGSVVGSSNRCYSYSLGYYYSC